jgi:HSP20 family protein
MKLKNCFRRVFMNSRSMVPFLSDWFDIEKNMNAFFGQPETYDKPLRVHTEEKDDKYVITAEVPGLKEDGLNVEYKDGVLSVAANYEEKKEESGYKSLRKGRYAWSCTVSNIDAESIAADLKDGMLTIDLPKSPEAKPRKIQISKS